MHADTPSRLGLVATLATGLALLPALPAQTPRALFAELGGHGLPVSSSTGMATGDVDGDGDVDVLVPSSQQNRLFLNEGSGVFREAPAGRIPATGEPTLDLALGDVDGDGDLDLVAGNGWTGYSSSYYPVPGQNRLFLNDGIGNFVDVTETQLAVPPAYANAVALGDLDGDGDLDLVTANGELYAVRQNGLYLNDGSGTFTDVTATHLPPDANTSESVALGDVDGDGDLDLVFGNTMALAGTSLYLNDGSGRFSDVTDARLPAQADPVFGLVLFDADGDGDLDLAIGINGRDRLLLNDGLGSFGDVTIARMPSLSESTRSLVVSDVDGDGAVDLVAGSAAGPQIYLGDGAGTFVEDTAARVPGEIFASEVRVADVDGDGDDDMLVGASRNRLLLNVGGRFIDTTVPPTPVPSLALATGPRDSALGDIDGDRDLDYLVGSSRSSRLYRNEGGGILVDVTTPQLPPAAGIGAIAMGDVDADGDLDLVLGALAELLFINDGTGTFADETAARLPSDTALTGALALVDVDGDTDLDLVVANARAQNLLYVNDGRGIYRDETAARLPVDIDGSEGLAVGDFDLDGDQDLVFANAGAIGEQNRLYLNDGAGRYMDATSIGLPAAHHLSKAIVTGDVDGDGDLDLVVANAFTGPARLYLNEGLGSAVFIDAGDRLPAEVQLTKDLEIGDLDGDGDLDLLFSNGSRDGRIYLNDGSGTFTDGTSILSAGLHRSETVAVGDLEGDGDLDIVFGATYRRDLLYTNLSRQLHTPFPLRSGRSFALDAYARGGSSSTDAALPFLALAQASIPVPALGTFGLDPTQLAALVPILIPQPAGVGTLTIDIPDVPSLIGTPLFGQALLSRDGALRLTNVSADVVIAR
ncbi:MAG: VCBS repeat-containing protein [Planctomycetota bacterium]